MAPCVSQRMFDYCWGQQLQERIFIAFLLPLHRLDRISVLTNDTFRLNWLFFISLNFTSHTEWANKGVSMFFWMTNHGALNDRLVQRPFCFAHAYNGRDLGSRMLVLSLFSLWTNSNECCIWSFGLITIAFTFRFNTGVSVCCASLADGTAYSIKATTRIQDSCLKIEGKEQRIWACFAVKYWPMLYLRSRNASESRQPLRGPKDVIVKLRTWKPNGPFRRAIFWCDFEMWA